MALTKEDGTGLGSAQTYADITELRTFAGLRGRDLTGEADATLEAALVRAMDYLEGKRDRYKGTKASEAQALQWPRSGAYGISMPDAIFPADEIPRELINAQIQAAIEALDADLQPNIQANQSGPVVEERVEGAVTVKYAAPTRQNFTPAFSKVDALLEPLLENRGLFLVRA